MTKYRNASTFPTHWQGQKPSDRQLTLQSRRPNSHANCYKYIPAPEEHPLDPFSHYSILLATTFLSFDLAKLKQHISVYFWILIATRTQIFGPCLKFLGLSLKSAYLGIFTPKEHNLKKRLMHRLHSVLSPVIT